MVRVVFEGAQEVGDGIWLAQLPSHEAAMFGHPKVTKGVRSILLVEGADFDPERSAIQVYAGGVSLLNLGTGSAALLVEAVESRPAKGSAVPPTRNEAAPSRRGPGDLEFLGLVERELEGNAREAALSLFEEVRSRYPGDLQRGKRSNFKNTPDNFWYVVVQPRVQSLSVTVRGDPRRFDGGTLELKEDRPGYTRFALRHPSEVQDAVRVIQQSKRK